MSDTKVSVLDLSNARIVAGGESYLYSGNFTEDDVVGTSMFAECDKLKSVTLPAQTVKLATCAFYRCSLLESVVIPETVEAIESNAFFVNSSLKSIMIPKNVQYIDDAVFCGCASLTAIDVAPENNWYKSVEGVLYNKDGDRLLAFPGGITGDYSVKPGISEIAPAAFNDCLLTKVTVPEGVLKIGDSAFSNSMVLESVSLPNSLKDIEEGMFIWCEKLNEIRFPEMLESIGKQAFVRCGSLTSVVVPSTVKTIGDAAFSSCGSLENVFIGAALENLGTDVFPSVAEPYCPLPTISRIMRTSVPLIGPDTASSVISYISDSEIISDSVPASVRVTLFISPKALKEVIAATASSSHCFFDPG